MKSYILHLPKWFPNLKDDLEGIFVLRHIQSTLLFYNAKVIYLRSFDIPSDKPYYFVDKKVSDGLEIYCIYYRNIYTGINWLDKLIKFLIYYKLSIKYISLKLKENGKPFAIHVHVLMRSAVTAYIYKLFYRIPYLITEHATQYTDADHKLRTGIKHYLRKFLTRQAERIITVSKNLHIGMLNYNLNNSNYSIIYNNVNTICFNEKTKTASTVLNCLHVSEFKDDHKNISGILEVIKELIQEGFPIQLLLVGYGRDSTLIKNLITKLALEDHVLLIGKLVAEQLARYYQEADIFLLFSNRENMPCVIAESLCCGTPVIATIVGGIPEVLNEQNGILISPRNKEELKEALIQFNIRRNTFDSKRISLNAQSKFSDQAIGIQHKVCYEAIYSGRLK